MRYGRPLIIGLLALAALVVVAGEAQPAHAATFTVTKTADTADGTCDADCSLREAIGAANALPGADTVEVPAGTYTLGIAGTGEDANAIGDLDIRADLTMNGAGDATTIIDGGALDRVFHIVSGTVEISDLTIQNGSGGGIFNGGTLTLNNSTVSGNTAGLGGGIDNANVGRLTLTNSTVSGNTASGGGGGIFGGTLTLKNSTVSGNTAGGDGGGIFSFTLTLNNSAVSGNTAADSGGGIFNGGTLTLNNSTVSGNTAGLGGGIDNAGTLTLNSSTVSGNTATFGGGGIFNDSAATATLKNTIVANSSPDDCLGGTTSAGYNLDSDGTCGLAGTGDISSTDPLLGPLADNGGPTQTHALVTGSPAIDAGSPDCPLPDTDQRGVARPQGAACDIGAYEFEPTDSDGDGFPDSVDGCPATPTPWLTPFGDPDCDGFTTSDENFIGTDPNLACGPNAWPPDHNNDGLISISDVLLMKASFGATSPDPAYDARRDLNPDGTISISDVLMMKAFFDQACS